MDLSYTRTVDPVVAGSSPVGLADVTHCQRVTNSAKPLVLQGVLFLVVTTRFAELIPIEAADSCRMAV